MAIKRNQLDGVSRSASTYIWTYRCVYVYINIVLHADVHGSTWFGIPQSTELCAMSRRVENVGKQRLQPRIV